jgi:hypothetical protein
MISGTEYLLNPPPIPTNPSSAPNVTEIPGLGDLSMSLSNMSQLEITASPLDSVVREVDEDEEDEEE